MNDLQLNRHSRCLSRVHLLHMHFEVTFVVESHIAECTMKQHLSRVYRCNMPSHILFTGKSFAAEFTRVWVNTSVSFKVHLQRGFIHKRFAAQFTGKFCILRLMNFKDVFSQWYFGTKCFFALVTMKQVAHITKIGSGVFTAHGLFIRLRYFEWPGPNISFHCCMYLTRIIPTCLKIKKKCFLSVFEIFALNFQVLCQVNSNTFLFSLQQTYTLKMSFLCYYLYCLSSL